MSSVKIFLDDYQNVCYPGQTMSGRVECQFDKEKTVKVISIEVRGHATTKWFESYGFNDTTTFLAEEIYINTLHKYKLLPGRDLEYAIVDEHFQLSAGRHVYPFLYVLPTKLPSSFVGPYGKVEYYLQATVERPWKSDYKSKTSLNVFSPLNLNLIPGLKNPVHVSVEETISSCVRNQTGLLKFNITLPVSGYVPGQDVSVRAYIQNMTHVTVTSVKFKIVATCEFITDYPSRHTRYSKKLLVDIVEGAVGDHEEKSWTTTLTLPTNFQYPNLMRCRILNVNYILVAKAVLRFPHTDLKLRVPFKVGNVPLYGVNTTLPRPLRTDPHESPCGLPQTIMPSAPFRDTEDPLQGSTAIPAPACPSFESYTEGDPPPHSSCVVALSSIFS